MATSRNFILTLNPLSLEYYEDIIQYLKGLSGLNYLLVTEHFGQSQKHYHVYVQYNNSKKLSIRRLHGAHVERCFGSAQQNIDYCKCNDILHRNAGVTAATIHEEGQPRLKGGDWSVGCIRDMDNPDELPGNLYNTYRRIQSQKLNRLSLGSWRKQIKVYWIQGPSAIGKSEKAENLLRDWYNDKGIENEDLMYFDELKYDPNGFYAGVNVEEPNKVAIFDDFRAGHMKPEEFINLIDYRVHNMNIKGDSVKNRYELIIFTSVQRFSSIYRNVEDYERREQWERRVEVINLYPPERVHIGGLPVGYRTSFNNLDSYEIIDDDNATVVIDKM